MSFHLVVRPIQTDLLGAICASMQGTHLRRPEAAGSTDTQMGWFCIDIISRAIKKDQPLAPRPSELDQTKEQIQEDMKRYNESAIPIPDYELVFKDLAEDFVIALIRAAEKAKTSPAILARDILREHFGLPHSPSFKAFLLTMPDGDLDYEMGVPANPEN